MGFRFLHQRAQFTQSQLFCLPVSMYLSFLHSFHVPIRLVPGAMQVCVCVCGEVGVRNTYRSEAHVCENSRVDQDTEDVWRKTGTLLGGMSKVG